MYAFGMIALLGLAVYGVAVLGYRYLRLGRELWMLLMIALSVGTAWLADLSLFAAWGVPVRNHAIGVWLTGVAVAGIGYFWKTILEFFAGISRKFTDQARTMEKSENLRRVA